MLIDLPDRDTLYRALVERDDRFDGHAFVCVQTTGIFCRLTCPARKPRPENCTFFATAVECLDAGYRPCRRCHPMAASAGDDPVIKPLLDALEAHPDSRWSEQRIRDMGFDVSTVRRSFRRQYGVTFLEIARQRRIRDGFGTLAAGGKVITAQHEAGFESPSAFRAAFARLLGQAPGKVPADALLLADWIRTPLGDMIAICCPTHLHLLEFADRKALPTEIRRLSGGTKGGIGIGRFLADELALVPGGRMMVSNDRFTVVHGLSPRLWLRKHQHDPIRGHDGRPRAGTRSGMDERPPSSDERTVLTRLLDRVPADSAVRARCTIETQLHRVLDVDLREDESGIRRVHASAKQKHRAPVRAEPRQVLFRPPGRHARTRQHRDP